MPQTSSRQRQNAEEQAFQNQLQEFNEFLVKIGFATDKRIIDPVQREKRRVSVARENNYHNTHKLLKNYRKIAWTIKTAPYDIADELGHEFSDIDRLLKDIDAADDESIKKVDQSIDLLKDHRRLIRLLHKAVAKLRIYPDHGGEMYKLIVQKYILDDKEENFETEFCRRNNISRATFNRLHKAALRLISQELWMVPNNEYELYLRIIKLFENDL